MRWTDLFDDLEAQLRAVDRAELEADIAEHTRVERGALDLVDRLAADLGRSLRLHVVGAGPLDGELVELGADWLVMRPGRDGAAVADLVLVPLPAVVTVQGLTGRADPGAVGGPRRWGLRQALRAISRDRAVVRVTDVAGGRHTGRIQRVGRDHLDLLPGPDGGWPQAASERARCVTVGYAGLATLVSPGAARG